MHPNITTVVHLDEEVSPDTMEDLEGDEESVKNIVSREELNEACSVIESGVEDVGWVYSAPKSVKYNMNIKKNDELRIQREKLRHFDKNRRTEI